jgi:DNA uptake protein ComE-like DNA-binding protein
MMHRARRSFATIIVLVAIGIAALILVTLQAAAWRSTASSRETLGRVRAMWAARAGVESTIAELAFNTTSPDLTNAYTVEDDMAAVSHGEVLSSSPGGGQLKAVWAIEHLSDVLGTKVLDGPIDEHARLNINVLTEADLALLPYVDDAIVDAVLDWADDDDDVRPFGAELGQYLTGKYPYEPRNAPLRTVEELELVLGLTPDIIREEDWNLNRRLDPNEDDGDLSWPPDDADGTLKAGWSALLTARSSRPASGEISASGQERLDLTTATSDEVRTRLNIEVTQAQVIVGYAQSSTSATMADFIRQGLSSISVPSTTGGTLRATDLTRDELALLFDECEIPDSSAVGAQPGKLNINTVDKETLQYLGSVDAGVLDSIIIERDARSQGFTSIVDLLDIPAVSREVLASLQPIIDVRSNVYTIVSRGRDEATGIEVEISATVDRSTLPITITDLTIR